MELCKIYDGNDNIYADIVGLNIRSDQYLLAQANSNALGVIWPCKRKDSNTAIYYKMKVFNVYDTAFPSPYSVYIYIYIIYIYIIVHITIGKCTNRGLSASRKQRESTGTEMREQYILHPKPLSNVLQPRKGQFGHPVRHPKKHRNHSEQISKI